ncbi:MAG: YpdA family putative bacillithiol disulfide reductase [Bryobacteraceae bacterium]
MESFDVLIVGAGPTGLACGIECKRRGLRVVLIDKGCVVNSLYHYPTNLVFFTTPELLEIGDIPMTSINEKPVRAEALKYYRRVAGHFELDIRQYQRVLSVEGSDGNFVAHAEDSGGTLHFYAARKVILATGYYDIPNELNVPGEELDKVSHYYREPHPYFERDVVVIGGKNSAALAALELWQTGARVTLVHRGETMSSSVKYWIRPNIDNRIKAAEIPAHFSSQVTEIRRDSVRIATPSGELEIPNDFVFALIGYRPDFEFLHAHGIAYNEATRRPVTDEATLESSRRGMYLAGVIVAGVHTNEIFIENGRFHGVTIANAIAAALKA